MYLPKETDRGKHTDGRNIDFKIPKIKMYKRNRI